MSPSRPRPGRSAAPSTPGQRVRRRLDERPELELSDEELHALADEGIDPDDVRRIARDRRDALEVGDHDRDTARDELEGLAMEADTDY